MSEPTTPIPPETPAVVRRPAASRFVPRGCSWMERVF